MSERNFPVVSPGGDPGELVGELVDLGAGEVIDFRRGTLDAYADADPREQFGAVADAVKAGFEPAWRESRRLADLLDVHPGEVLAYSGYSDFVDLLDATVSGGCTTVGTRASPDSPPVYAQTWDYLKFYEDHSAVVRRAPADGHDHVALTTLLGHAYMGVNAAGVCVLINNLQGERAQVGLPFSVVVHELLHRAGSAAEAVDILEETAVMSTHNYLVGDAESAYNVEAGADGSAVTEIADGQVPWVHTNHALEETGPAILEYSGSSRPRYERARALLEAAPSAVPAVFDDHDAPLCRHGSAPEDVATIGVVWVTYDPPRLHTVRGTPCANGGRAVGVR